MSEVIGIPPWLVNDPRCVLYLRGEAPDGNTRIRDWSQSHKTVTVHGDVHNSTTQTKFPPAAIYFDGIGDYLSLADSPDWYFGAGNFTISTWLDCASLPSSENSVFILNQRPDVNNTQSIQLVNTGGVYSLLYNCYVSGTEIIRVNKNISITANSRNHATLVRDIDGFKFFFNGVQAGDTTTSSATIGDFSANLDIGRWSGDGSYYAGFFDEFAIWKGWAIPIEKLYPQYRRFVV